MSFSFTCYYYCQVAITRVIPGRHLTTPFVGTLFTLLISARVFTSSLSLTPLLLSLSLSALPAILYSF